jgi:hypothetical protein
VKLDGPKRAEVVQAIAAAWAHGDLSENFVTGETMP